MVIAITILFLGESTYLLFLYGGLYGIFRGFEALSNAVLWPNYFGREHLGSIRGSAMTAMVIGSSLGPLPFGLAYDYLGGYELMLVASIILAALGILASYFAPRPEYE